jgi:molecular chaperone DnaJ
MGMVMQSDAPCPECRGVGKKILNPCQRCKGKGKVRRSFTNKVKVPAGIDNDQTLRVGGEGCCGSNGGPAGDLLVNVRIKPHAIFKRQGTGVYCELPISFAQAALGAEIEVPTIDGKAPINIAEGTQTGTVIRLKGKGIPYLRSAARGDQFVTVIVETPTHLSKEQKELLRQFEQEASEKTNPKRKKFFDLFR